jgi:hypothetical protein
MIQTSITYVRPWLSVLFTLWGKAGPRPHGIAATMAKTAALLLILAPVPAMARSEMGQTSSATIGISLSIAPKFGLGIPRLQTPILEHAAAGPGALCMATNGRPTLLPILLVRSPAGKAMAGNAEKESAQPLGWCASGSDIDAPRAGGEWKGLSRLLIVRPE